VTADFDAIERQPLAVSKAIEDWNSFVMTVHRSLSPKMSNSLDEMGGRLASYVVCLLS
jgi:hypothetical protein